MNVIHVCLLTKEEGGEGLARLVCLTCIKDNFVRGRAFNKNLKLHNEKVLEMIKKNGLKSL